MPSPTRVLLVDDQELMRSGFKLLLLAEQDIVVCGEASNGQEALEVLERLDGQCDVVLMDVRMPHMNGIEATERIAALYPDIKVLVLTTFDLDEYAHSAVRAGASGFLLKDARPTELIDAIHRVAAGDAVMAPSMMRRMLVQMRDHGMLEMASSSENMERDVREDSGLLDALTEREREVFALIAEGLNNSEISARLFLSESTVKTHVGRILFKLDLRDRIHAVILAKELGI